MNIRGCKHHVDGVSLITLGTRLHGGEGVAQAVCRALPKQTLEGVCFFHLESFSGLLGQCLESHKSAVIVVATKNGSAPGTLSLLDLGGMLQHHPTINLSSCHELSLADELTLAKQTNRIPNRIILVGIESSQKQDSMPLRDESSKQLPSVVSNICRLVTTVVDTVKRYA